MTLKPADSIDWQQPRIVSVQPGVTTGGPEAAEIARRVGVILDPWQAMVLDGTLAQTAEGEWAASETGLIAGRQTGKNGVLEPLELYGLFILGEQILHTAHRLDTSRKAHGRLWTLIKRSPELLAKVAKRRTANEEQSIELYSGAKIEFTVRSDEGGRGTSYDRIVYDEAFALTEGHVGALAPTLISKSDFQLNYLSSAGMSKSLVLHELRKRGIAGEPGLTYYEWSTDPGAYKASPERARRDRGLLRQALPALGGRLRFETIEKLRSAMPEAEFDREVLCIWDEPVLALTKWAVIEQAQWSAAADRSSTPMDPVCFAVDVTPDRSRTAIGMAAKRPDGRRTVEIVEDRPGTDWAPKRLAELVRKWDPCAVVLDPSGPAGSLLPGLVTEKIEAVTTSAREMAQACGGFFDAVVGDHMRHRDDSRLNSAVEWVGKRTLSGAFAWNRLGEAYIHTLVAVTLADWGLAVHGNPKPPPQYPVTIPSNDPAARRFETADLAHQGF